MAGLKQLSLGSGNNFIVIVSGLVSTIAAEENVSGSEEEIMPMSAQWIIIGSEENLKEIYFLLYDLTRAVPKMCFKGRSLSPVCRGLTDAGLRGGWGPGNQGSTDSNCSQSQQENTQHTCWYITGLMSRVTKCDAVPRCLFVVRLWVNVIGRKLATVDHPGFCLQ